MNDAKHDGIIIYMPITKTFMWEGCSRPSSHNLKNIYIEKCWLISFHIHDYNYCVYMYFHTCYLQRRKNIYYEFKF